LNASLDCSELTLSLFAPYTDSKTVVSVGDLVYFSNPNSKSYLRESSGSSTVGGAAEEHTFEFAKFKKNLRESSIHVSGYFLVESSPYRDAAKSSKEGGKIEWDEHVKLRHFNTGRYVQLVGGRLCTATAQETANVCCVPARCARRGADAKHVSVDCATTLHVRESQKGSAGTTGNSFSLMCDDAGVVSMQRDDGIAASETPLLVHKECEEERALEILMAHDAQMVLQSLKNTLDGDLSSAYRSHMPKKTKKVAALFEQLHGFIRGSNSTLYSATRQQLLQEQGILTHVIDIIERLNPLLKKKEKEEKEEQKMDECTRKALLALLNSCFVILRRCFIHHPDSQLFVAHRFEVLLRYVDSEGALMDSTAYGALMDCITTMLDNNEIQEKKVEQAEVDRFIAILRTPSPLAANVMVLKLLSAFCICQGQPIRKNQNMLARSLLGAKKSRASIGIANDEAVQAAMKGNEKKKGTVADVEEASSHCSSQSPGGTRTPNNVIVRFVRVAGGANTKRGTKTKSSINIAFPMAIKGHIHLAKTFRSRSSRRKAAIAAIIVSCATNSIFLLRCATAGTTACK
jgi:hypothetical protein